MNCKSIKGVSIHTIEYFSDKRGSFFNQVKPIHTQLKEIWDSREIAQVNLSVNPEKATLRGLHYQIGKYSEAKLIRCLKGSIYDVVVDLRRQSKTFGEWYGVRLNADGINTIFIPEGCAHGFQTTEENVLLSYIHSKKWVKESEGGIRWSDQKLKVEWPLTPLNISSKDQTLPCFNEENEF